MLENARLTAFVATTDAARARAFYVQLLGLEVESEDDFALVLNCQGTQLRVQKVQNLQPATYTVLGWQVRDLRQNMVRLVERGVAFEKYGFLQQDDLGIWTAPGGARVAWFKDPDGNLLSLAQPVDMAP